MKHILWLLSFSKILLRPVVIKLRRQHRRSLYWCKTVVSPHILTLTLVMVERVRKPVGYCRVAYRVTLLAKAHIAAFKADIVLRSHLLKIIWNFLLAILLDQLLFRVLVGRGARTDRLGVKALDLLLLESDKLALLNVKLLQLLIAANVSSTAKIWLFVALLMRYWQLDGLLETDKVEVLNVNRCSSILARDNCAAFIHRARQFYHTSLFLH